MFSHWSRPQFGLAPHAVQEVVHRKQNLATRGCVIASYCVDNSGCLDLDHPQLGLATDAVQEVVHRKQNLATRGCVIASYCVDNSGCPWGKLLIFGASFIDF